MAASRVRLTLPDGSRTEASQVPGPDGRYEVVEAGPQPVWKLVEDCHARWLEVDRPGWDRFGVRATAEDQYVWFDTPRGRHTWRLPDPDR